MMTPTACIKPITPLLVKPTTITVVMELDWTTQVTMVPTKMANQRLPVTVLISRRKLLPATACMPSDMCFMPSKKMPKPPTNSQISCVKDERFNGPHSCG